MSDYTSDNKRIAKNTLYLYIRTLVVMLISIYTSRIVLQALGIADYGIFQVIGGLVAMFAMVSNALSAAISRFITYEIGSGDKERLDRIFSTSRVILLVLAGFVLVLTEVLGMWFLTTKMQIPDGRMSVAIWVLHCSVVTFCVSLTAIPYIACVIAHEQMKFFAYMSILDAILKLGVCLLVLKMTVDRLMLYAILIVIIAIIDSFVYFFYCYRHFAESRCRLHFYKSNFKEMFGFAGWSFFTSTTSVFSSQGIDMLINVFYGVTYNAARGITNQVNNAFVQFVSSFVSAINPQITKSYASGDMENLYTLICRGARFSFYLTLVMFVPLFFEIEMILAIWLTEVPERTALFVRLAMINILLDGAGYTSYTANLATGKIKKYSIVLSSITAFTFPLTWIAYYNGGPVQSTYYLAIVSNVLYHIARMYLTQENVGLSVTRFIQEIYWPVFKTTIIAIIPPVIIIQMMDDSYTRFFMLLVVGVGMSAVAALFVGMTQGERIFIIGKVNAYLKKVWNR